MSDQQANGLDAFLMDVWQEGGGEAVVGVDMRRQIRAWADAFDRRIFFRNALEYGAGAVVLARSALEFAAGERHWTVPLTSVVITLFILGYLWQKNRQAEPVDPDASAAEYRAALLARIDRQIELAASARYWYVLPAWLFFVVVFVTGALRTPTAVRIAQFGMEFLLATGVAILIVFLNERYGLRGLRRTREQVAQMQREAMEQ